MMKVQSRRVFVKLESQKNDHNEFVADMSKLILEKEEQLKGMKNLELRGGKILSLRGEIQDWLLLI